jgi:RNA polymerase sigma-70 factor (ECF subfamily)
VARSATGSDLASIEKRILAALEDRDRHLAVTLILEGYGPEIMRFLFALHRDEVATQEVFSSFAEAVWTAWRTFQRRSSVRTWVYGVARRTSLRYRRDARRRLARFPIAHSSIGEVEARVRSETLSFLRTDRRRRLDALRDALSPDERMLLILRVDRGLSWEELAKVMSARAETPTGETLRRATARLRKRFQALKERLREAAKREGLVARDGDDA